MTKAPKPSERAGIAAYTMREAGSRYGSRGKADIEEALERIAQLILRSEHERSGQQSLRLGEAVLAA
jgi:hypothetical protein